jgi:hypothetical protein
MLNAFIHGLKEGGFLRTGVNSQRELLVDNERFLTGQAAGLSNGARNLFGTEEIKFDRCAKNRNSRAKDLVTVDP